MDGINQAVLNDFSESHSSRSQAECSEHQPTPCASCRGFDCHSMHGQAPVRKECLETCYFCADLARIDDEIASTCKRLADLVQQRKKAIAKPNHNTLIHFMPVEIICLIFFFLHDAIIDVRFDRKPKIDVPRWCATPHNRQPSQSPPLLLSAVCKQWRDITLVTPQLWTDIIINLRKCPDGQLNMVEAWASRSAPLPLDIYIANRRLDCPSQKYYTSDEYGNLLSALRSLADRWAGISLDVPAWFFDELFNNIQGAPHIRSIYQHQDYSNSQPWAFEMTNPLHPRCFVSRHFSWTTGMPLEWDRLVFLDVREVSSSEIVHIIHSAQNLQYCLALGRVSTKDGHFPWPTRPSTNRSLIYLNTNRSILDYLTLPCLSYLEYEISSHNGEEINSLAQFIGRSCPPLHDFILQYHTRGRLTISLESLPEITSLFIHYKGKRNCSTINILLQALVQPSGNVILPRLQALFLSLPSPQIPASTWLLISNLFPKTQMYAADAETIPDSTSIALGRPLSKLTVRVYNGEQISPVIHKDTFLRLLAVKKLGVVDLILTEHKYGRDFDLFKSMAEDHEIEL